MAWAGASLTGVAVAILSIGATNVMVKGGAWLSIETFVLASSLFYACSVVFIAPFSALIVFAVRATRIRRPWADTVGGAAAAIAGTFAANAVGELIVYRHLVGDPKLVPYALISGLIAGPVYWWLAGKPRPPYSQMETLSE